MAGYSFRTDAAKKNTGFGGKGNFRQAAPRQGATNGCKKGTDKNGQTYITGWNKSKDRGFVAVNIHPYHGSKEIKSGNGKTFVVMMASIEYKDSGTHDHYPVLYCTETGYVLLKKHGWILNDKKGNMTRFTGKKS